MTIWITFIAFGIGLFICLLLFIIDERRHRHATGKEANEWLTTVDEETGASVYNEYPYKQDILFQLTCVTLPRIKLFGKRYLGNFGALILFFFIIPWLLYLFAAIVDGTLTLPGKDRGLLEYPAQALTLVIPAVVLYLYRGVIENTPRGFISLREANDQKPESEMQVNNRLQETANYVMQTRESRGKKAVIIDLSLFAFLAAVLVPVFWSGELFTADYISNTSPQYFFGHLVFVVYYTVAACYFLRLWLGYVFRLIFSMQSIAKKLSVKDNKILQVQPVHPDKAGGLGGFGKLAWRIDVQLIPLIIILLVWLFVQENINATIIITMTIIIMLVPFFFFIPLRGFNKAMKETKQDELKYLSKKFRKQHLQLKKLEEKKKGVIDDELRHAEEDLERVTLQYDRAMQMPVWPFDRSTIGKVATTIIVPIVIVLIQVVIQNLVEK